MTFDNNLVRGKKGMTIQTESKPYTKRQTATHGTNAYMKKDERSLTHR